MRVKVIDAEKKAMRYKEALRTYTPVRTGKLKASYKVKQRPGDKKAFYVVNIQDYFPKVNYGYGYHMIEKAQLDLFGKILDTRLEDYTNGMSKEEYEC